MGESNVEGEVFSCAALLFAAAVAPTLAEPAATASHHGHTSAAPCHGQLSPQLRADAPPRQLRLLRRPLPPITATRAPPPISARMAGGIPVSERSGPSTHVKHARQERTSDRVVMPISAATRVGRGPAVGRHAIVGPPLCFGRRLRTPVLGCQQKVELVGRILRPGRRQDRNRKAIRGKLAGQDHGIDAAGTDIGDAVIVFYRFDDEGHVDYRSTPIAYRKSFMKLNEVESSPELRSARNLRA